MLQWLIGNWKNVVIAVLAIDAALIPLFPSVGLLGKIKQFLTPLVSKQ